MKHFSYFIFTLILITSCENQTKNQTNEKSNTASNNTTKQSEYTVLSIQNPDLSWGYQILKDGKLIIDQKNIPAIQGNRGFKSQEDAEKTSNFVVLKIKNGDFPPTVSMEELDSIGVLLE